MHAGKNDWGINFCVNTCGACIRTRANTGKYFWGGISRVFCQILRGIHSVRIHAVPVFAPARIQENTPGELFMYWFRARGYCPQNLVPPPPEKGSKWGKTAQISRESSKLTLFPGAGGERTFMDKTILWTSGRFWRGPRSGKPPESAPETALRNRGALRSAPEKSTLGSTPESTPISESSLGSAFGSLYPDLGVCAVIWAFWLADRIAMQNLEDPNLLKLRSLDSCSPFFLSDNSIWGQWTEMLQMLWSQG